MKTPSIQMDDEEELPKAPNPKAEALDKALRINKRTREHIDVSPSKPTTKSSIADSNHHDNQLVTTFSLLNSPSILIFGLPNSPIIMTGRGGGGGGGGGRRVLLPPINMIFKLLQSNATVSVWLYEQLSIRIEGKIRGFDEFMNLVIDDAVEVSQITKTNEEETRRSLGQILLKGDNVSLIQNLSS
ncbi:hypothetical protein E4U40_003583 [Claviceps sp. LM458 group G5]|nr:hypothetical protein E4U40_003583 [Claviceps sp. LM458 group G5]